MLTGKYNFNLFKIPVYFPSLVARNCICPSHFRLLFRQTPRKLKLSTFSIGILFMISLGTKELICSLTHVVHI